jgi:hypothetical protein
MLKRMIRWNSGADGIVRMKEGYGNSLFQGVVPAVFAPEFGLFRGAAWKEEHQPNSKGN